MAPIEADFTNSNVIPITLFSAYLLLTTTLTIFATRTLHEAHKSLPPSAAVRNRRITRIHHVEFYLILASISLLSAAYLNWNTVNLSYSVWEYERDYAPLRPLGENLFQRGHVTQWGRWLRDTDLLGEVFEIAVERSRRRWWAQQLLQGAVPWSVFVVVEGQRRRIPHLWAFVGLGPLVSLPFAQALFFLAILWTPVPLSQRRKRRDVVDSNHPLFFVSVVVSFWSTVFLPFTTGTAAFKVALALIIIAYLAPLAVPLFARDITAVEAKSRTHQHTIFRIAAASSFLIHIAHFAIALLDTSDPRAYWNRHSSILHHSTQPPTWKQAQSRVAKILNSATDHPSVTKIAVDTVLAAIGLFAWTAFRGLRVRELLSSVGLWGQMPERALDQVVRGSAKAVSKAKEGARRLSESVSGSARERRAQANAPVHDVAVEDEDEYGEGDADYEPSTGEKLLEGDDDRQQSAEATALSWGLSVAGGLGYVTAGTLGAETTA